MPLQTGPDASALLTTALEKLLYLESRLESAEAAREDANRETDRQKHAALAARRVLSEWQRRATEAEVSAEGAEREVSLLRGALDGARQALNASPREAELGERLHDAEERLVRSQREREGWLDRMVSLSRLRANGEDELDLGSFIAELRSEVLALRSGEFTRVRPTVSDRLPPVDAGALVADARSTKVDVDELVRVAKLPRAERTLAVLCARDLASTSAAVRRRAAERVAESGIAALNPLALEVLHAEPDVHVRVALVRLLDRTGQGEAIDLALTLAQGDEDPRVRTAALEGLARRRNTSVVGALSDSSASVRRRAVALLGRDSAALDHLADALRDEDASVRRVAALALAARTGVEATALLQVAAHFDDPAIRELARDTLERRGIALAELTDEPASIPEPGPTEPLAASPREAEPMPADEPATAPAAVEPLIEPILDEIRMSLRGRTPEELAAHLRVNEQEVAAAIEKLTMAGVLIWRGRKLYLP